MTRTLLVGGELLDPEAREPLRTDLLISQGRIEARLGADDAVPDDARRIDLSGLRVAPGLIDLHVHGAAIFQPIGSIEESIRSEAASSMRHGVTANLVTTVAWEMTRVKAFVSKFASIASWNEGEGTAPIGLHLEGPWISAAAAGAQPIPGIRGYRDADGVELLDAACGAVKMVTLAPEVAGADALLAELDRRGIVAALGHSLADEAGVERAIERGARHVTHLFNAMGPLHQREAGLAATALTDERLSCDLICDGAHVHPRMVAVAARACGERLALISDRISPPGRSAGEGAVANFGAGQLYDDGAAWRLPDGRLAGSRLTLDRALRNLIEFAGVPVLDAVAACTLRPARVLGIEAERGSLRVGARADFALFDHAMALRETWIAGRRVHSA